MKSKQTKRFLFSSFQFCATISGLNYFLHGRLIINHIWNIPRKLMINPKIFNNHPLPTHPMYHLSNKSKL